MSLKALITDKKAKFVEYHSGNLFYELDGNFRFPVPVEELDGASIKSVEKATVLLKWIRKTYRQINNG